MQKLLDKIKNFPKHKISYQRIKIKKRSGGYRNLLAPDKELKELQKEILHEFLYKFQVHPLAMGFCKNKNVIKNAKLHFGARSILVMDLRDFFDSISIREFFSFLKRQRLIELNDEEASAFIDVLFRNRVLPQGAPTSPAIANLVFLAQDKLLSALATKMGLKYSRYADDIVFSSTDRNYNFYPIKQALQKWSEGLKFGTHSFNEKKTRVLRYGKRMEITGVVINDVVTLPKRFYKTLRATIHNILKNNITLEEPQWQVLNGQVSWYRAVCGPNRNKTNQILQEFGKIKYHKS